MIPQWKKEKNKSCWRKRSRWRRNKVTMRKNMVTLSQVSNVTWSRTFLCRFHVLFRAIRWLRGKLPVSLSHAWASSCTSSFTSRSNTSRVFRIIITSTGTSKPYPRLTTLVSSKSRPRCTKCSLTNSWTIPIRFLRLVNSDCTSRTRWSSG